MILVDTSVWIGHLRAGDAELVSLLEKGSVLAHPFVIGEIALGSLRHRGRVLDALADLPQASIATEREVLHFIDRNKLHSLGIGYVDAHLLVAVRLKDGVSLWTRDKRLRAVAARLSLAAVHS